ncbi:MAG: flagellar export protein FliJ [Epsilonproteobacteria bacterium]|nr:MAG: flagellar export protein FliJ [Campylobacterota bacterium]RLA66137.1 MAG: flagellar export protein FliJ [Campylobacterota bacterium]
MKKFNFRLDSILKLREFEEKKAKLNLGKVITKIQLKKREIEKLNKEITMGYDEMGSLLQKTVSGKMLHFFPSYLEGKRAMIKLKEEEMSKLNEELKFRKLELKKAEGEYKSIDKLKEKQFERFKKKIAQKEQKDMDDYTIMKYGGSHE